jgi:hypothetical protein
MFGGLAVTDSRSKNRYKKKNQIYTEFHIHYKLLTPKTLGGFPPPSLTQTTTLYLSILHPTHATFPPPLKPTKSPPNSLHLSAFLPVLPLFSSAVCASPCIRHRCINSWRPLPPQPHQASTGCRVAAAAVAAASVRCSRVKKFTSFTLL